MCVTVYVRQSHPNETAEPPPRAITEAESRGDGHSPLKILQKKIVTIILTHHTGMSAQVRDGPHDRNGTLSTLTAGRLPHRATRPTTLVFEWLRERTEHLDVFLFSAHHSVVFYFRCSVYWWKGSVRF